MKPTDNARLKRLYFQSCHRGCKETDLILGQFAEQSLESMSPGDLDVFEVLLEESDADIWNWVVGKGEAPDAKYDALLARIRQFKPYVAS